MIGDLIFYGLVVVFIYACIRSLLAPIEEHSWRPF